jgi:hypothetical protein
MPHTEPAYVAHAEPGVGVAINVTDYGVVNDDDSHDNSAAINAIIAGAQAGSTLYFPPATGTNGYYYLRSPINITKRLRFVGSMERQTQFRAGSDFTGYYMFRTWTDAESATEAMPSSIGTARYPIFEHLGFLQTDLTNVTCIGIAPFDEQTLIRNCTFNALSCTRARAVRLKYCNGGVIENVSCFSDSSTPWGNELRVEGGASILVKSWVSAQNAHTESPFYFTGAHNVRMTQCNIEANAGAVAGAATIQLADSYDFSLTDSLVSVHSVATSRPIILASNSHAAGYSFPSPVLRNVQVEGCLNYMTGNLIEDSAQSGNVQTLSAAAHPCKAIDLYDGRTFEYRDPVGSTGVALHRRYNLHAGLKSYEGWAAAAPAVGTYSVGDRIWNPAPAAGGTDHWVCTTATPGTAVAFVSSSSNVASGATCVVTAPAGIQDGDILVFVQEHYKSGGPANISMPAGFAAWNGKTISTDYKYTIGWKRASGESGDYTFGGGAGCTAMMVAMSVYRNCATTGDPADAGHSSTAYAANDTIVRATVGFVPASSGRYVWAGFAQGSAQTIAAPTGITQREYPTLTNDTRLLLGDKAYTYGSGTVGDVDGAAGVATAIKFAFAYVVSEAGPVFKAIAVGA